MVHLSTKIYLSTFIFFCMNICMHTKQLSIKVYSLFIGNFMHKTAIADRMFPILEKVLVMLTAITYKSIVSN